jgi:hypothetical protein
MTAKDAPGQQQAAARAPAEDVCTRDEGRLQRLRAEPNLDEIRKLERELSSEQLRSQMLRLRTIADCRRAGPRWCVFLRRYSPKGATFGRE